MESTDSEHFSLTDLPEAVETMSNSQILKLRSKLVKLKKMLKENNCGNVKIGYLQQCIRAQKHKNLLQMIKTEKAKAALLTKEAKLEDQALLLQEKEDKLQAKKEELKLRQASVERMREKKQAVEDTLMQDSDQLKSDAAKLQTKITEFSTKKETGYSRFLRNTVQELRGNIRVLCRVRAGPEEGVRVRNDHLVEVTLESKRCLKGMKVGKEKGYEPKERFVFDHCFVQGSTQEEVFCEVQNLVTNALDGYKVCIFAYGQTGSGKTYTMEGEYHERQLYGIIPRTVVHIFDLLSQREKDQWRFEIQCCFQEIYMNQIRDLLDPENCMTQMNKASSYEPTLVKVYSTESEEKQTPVTEIFDLLKTARENRVTSDNKFNARSSRSHSIFQLFINSVQENSEKKVKFEGCVNLIDLAGSERLHKTQNVSKKVLEESKAINYSLSCLKDVIQAISSNSSTEDQEVENENHVPFRNSKLTYFLKPQLTSESAKTLMIVNASSESAHIPETINSLRFATEVNKCVVSRSR
ncbi:unnamed protein product [Moneuplotes crassus]|uniref:Kinesin motor domain-containing protein n=1 Tax=Euplotes crassus TaxID=5936 RepID=A0AAD1UAT3_EUPCR|nr:unnamed protein product [Moneuplotes crassus]